MADISHLGNLNPSEPLDLDTYKLGSGGRPFPPRGRYTLQAPEQFTFGKTKAGNLSAQIDPTIVGPAPYDGRQLLYTRVSAKTFESGPRKGASQLGDYLKATGREGALSGDPQQAADAVVETANRTFEAELDWTLYHKPTQLKIEGMENFPTNGDGQRQPYIDSPSGELNEDGTPKRVWANLYIRRFLPATTS